jgi:SAM-dependent methyltransferase
MARTGHSVTAIDPRAPEGPIFRRVRIEELPDPGPFDHVVASLSLHHVEDIGRVLDKIADLLRAGGTLVVVEFAWDRFNEATAEWALERLPASSSPEKPSWLQHRCWEWARGGQGGTRAPAGTYFAGWESAEGMHGSRRMLDELGRRFDKCLFEIPVARRRSWPTPVVPRSSSFRGPWRWPCVVSRRSSCCGGALRKALPRGAEGEEEQPAPPSLVEA